MNTVLNSYGQLYGCPEILKKVINFFVVGLTYGWRKVCAVIFLFNTRAAFSFKLNQTPLLLCAASI